MVSAGVLISCLAAASASYDPVTVKVVDRSTGMPISGAHVLIDRLDDGTDIAKGDTDVKGEFTTDHVDWKLKFVRVYVTAHNHTTHSPRKIERTITVGVGWAVERPVRVETSNWCYDERLGCWIRVSPVPAAPPPPCCSPMPIAPAPYYTRPFVPRPTWGTFPGGRYGQPPPRFPEPYFK